ncbi:MAG: hypothetical protein LBQ66_10345 [Planctomycetaceae bacterium]|jgi:hypothetical protein|nr:hypothetical protein [Planctomycetaceae bacterium]
MSTVATEISNIKGQRVRFVQTSPEKGHSNFLFLRNFLDQRRINQKYIPSLIRIFSLARKLHFKGMLVDQIPCEESEILEEENKVLTQKCIEYASSEVYKFSFFGKDSEDDINTDSFLGYAVLKIDRDSHGQPLCNHIFESVIAPPRLSEQNNFLHCRRKYRVSNTLGDGFVIEGSLYAQQNIKTFVCAHVALRAALACILPEGDISYQRLAQLAGKRDGLEPADIDRVFTGLGLHSRKIEFEPCPHNTKSQSIPCPEYMREMYGFIESGSPVLLGFELADGRRHIVPVLGHTFNEDSWVPPSNRGYFKSQNLRFFSSEQWLSSNLIHDDNFGPYYCMPRQFLTKANFRLLYGIGTQKAALHSINAELTAIDFFHQSVSLLAGFSIGDPWMDLFQVFADQKRLVLRAVYISKEEYLEHLQKISADDSIDGSSAVGAICKVLPTHFWMVEASMQELFSASRKKFGEVIICPDGEDVTFNPCSFICMRLPSCVIIRDTYDCSKHHLQQCNIKGHTPIYSSTPCRH